MGVEGEEREWLVELRMKGDGGEAEEEEVGGDHNGSEA